MKLVDLGKRSYAEAYEIQKDFLDQRMNDKVEDTLILVEHHPVYTIGRAASVKGNYPKEIKIPKLGKVKVWETERGGKITFHGPGQIVGYPIFHLKHHDLRRYLKDLEKILCETLSEQALLPAKPCPESLILEPGQLQTGVWIHDRKIASIGIAVKRWISCHGFALNVSTDLRYFNVVEPCGFQGNIMTTVQKELGPKANMKTMTANLKSSIVKRFEVLSNRYQTKPIKKDKASSPEASA